MWDLSPQEWAVIVGVILLITYLSKPSWRDVEDDIRYAALDWVKMGLYYWQVVSIPHDYPLRRLCMVYHVVLVGPDGPVEGAPDRVLTVSRQHEQAEQFKALEIGSMIRFHHCQKPQRLSRRDPLPSDYLELETTSLSDWSFPNTVAA